VSRVRGEGDLPPVRLGADAVAAGEFGETMEPVAKPDKGRSFRVLARAAERAVAPDEDPGGSGSGADEHGAVLVAAGDTPEEIEAATTATPATTTTEDSDPQGAPVELEMEIGSDNPD